MAATLATCSWNCTSMIVTGCGSNAGYVLMKLHCNHGDWLWRQCWLRAHEIAQQSWWLVVAATLATCSWNCTAIIVTGCGSNTGYVLMKLHSNHGDWLWQQHWLRAHKIAQQSWWLVVAATLATCSWNCTAIMVTGCGSNTGYILMQLHFNHGDWLWMNNQKCIWCF